MIVRIIILFLFTAILVSYNIPKISRDSHVSFKIYIFFGIFLFELLSGIFIRMYNTQIVDTEQIIRQSITSGLIGVVAYSIYTDLTTDCKSSTRSFSDDGLGSKHTSEPITDTINKQNLLIALLITFGIGINYGIEQLLRTISPEINDRLDNAYGVDNSKQKE